MLWFIFALGTIWYFPLFWCMVMLINECKTKGNTKLYVLRVILNRNTYFKKWLIFMIRSL